MRRALEKKKYKYRNSEGKGNKEEYRNTSREFRNEKA